MVVMDSYIVSGYMETSASELKNSETGCPERATGAAGKCQVFEWTPAVRGWVGVAFQYPADNWTGPGLCIAEGAKKVVFKARGEAGGEVVSFSAVGAELKDQALTKEWKDYAIDLTGVPYNKVNAAGGVNAGFVVVLAATDKVTRKFYVDDIRWVAE
jgi:hypothetical protein